MSESKPEPKTQIAGVVAQILNSRELVLNVGDRAGVELGMHFDVLDPKGENIKDPVTGKRLGSLRRRKVRVEVKDVQDKLSVASTFRRTRVNVGGSAPLLEDIGSFALSLMPPQWVVRYETLRADDKDWEDLSEDESYVKVGDPVIQVLPPDEQKPARASLQSKAPQ